MSDVEGVRNLVGTGLVEFAGGVMTAVFALGYLLRISALMTGGGIHYSYCLWPGINKAFGTIRPSFARARK
jgi:hypothetical protein